MAKNIIIAVAVLCLFSCQAHAAVTCTAAGRFADTNDTTCQNYTLCVLDSTGSYVAYNYVCPTQSVFNPNTAQCTASTNYVCNNTITNSTDSSNSTDTANSTSVCTSDGYFADSSSTNCSTYIQCVQINGTYTETTYTCPDETYYNPDTTLCEADYNCTSTNAFSCSSAGRFSDSSDSTCQNYYYCVLLSNGSYAQYTYTCPTTSVFNPNTAQCTASSNYVCNSTSTNSTDSTNSTSVCTSDGYFADSSSTNCSTYIECVEINSTYTETTYTCPDETYYNANTTLCEPDYNCTSTSAFSCRTAGRFSDSSDTTCQTYYYCVLLSNGTYTQYTYICPNTSVFNPTSKMCTSTYTCPTS